MAIPLPPGAELIDADEAVRRIQERDHYVPSGRMGTSMSDEVIISLIRKGAVLVALATDRQLCFWPVDLETGEPFDPDNPDHVRRAKQGR